MRLSFRFWKSLSVVVDGKLLLFCRGIGESRSRLFSEIGRDGSEYFRLTSCVFFGSGSEFSGSGKRGRNGLTFSVWPLFDFGDFSKSNFVEISVSRSGDFLRISNRSGSSGSPFRTSLRTWMSDSAFSSTIGDDLTFVSGSIFSMTTGDGDGDGDFDFDDLVVWEILFSMMGEGKLRFLFNKEDFAFETFN